MGLPIITDHVNTDDYVMIVQDGCIRMVTYEEFIKNISLSGFSICAAVLACWEDIGDFPTDPITPEDTPPTFEDLYISLANRTQNFVIAENLFLQNYYDAEGHEFRKVIIKGGDLSGVTFMGQPVYPGLIIMADELVDFKFNAKDQNPAYQQMIDIEVYDENNVKAI